MHDRNSDRKLNFEEFYEMISNPDLQYVFGHYMNRWNHSLAIPCGENLKFKFIESRLRMSSSKHFNKKKKNLVILWFKYFFFWPPLYILKLGAIFTKSKICIHHLKWYIFFLCWKPLSFVRKLTTRGQVIHIC